MQLFITGTDTDVGKTLISSWLCLHTGYAYFKPVQTGSLAGRDSDIVKQLTPSVVYKETFLYQAPLSPHLSARLEGATIDITQIRLPCPQNLIVEGAGGVLVPLHQHTLMIDLIKQLAIPVIVVARTTLGTINHTLLTLESLRARHIPVIGVIMNGTPNSKNAEAISLYGATPVLATFPVLKEVSPATLKHIALGQSLQQLFKSKR